MASIRSGANSIAYEDPAALNQTGTET